ncbi:MAG: hypothetical protein Q4D88_04820 [Anaerococcus sp.]|nr:hypothetical protein [Anaerococcus sp.]
MKKKKIVLLSLIILLSTIFNISPNLIFAEVEKSDWTIEEEKLAQMDYWPLGESNKVEVVANAEGIKTPTINYIGTYTNAYGRTVLRLSYRKFQNLKSAVWKKGMLKFDKDLYDLIDFTDSATGLYGGLSNGWYHDSSDRQTKVDFYPVPTNVSGSNNVMAFDFIDTNPIGHSVDEFPIDLVLKEGYSETDIIGEPHIQMRILDSNFNRVFSLAGTKSLDKNASTDGSEIYPYGSYTFMTFIPSESNDYSLGTESSFENSHGGGYEFYGANAFARYNEDLGYFDIVYKQSKGLTWVTAWGSHYALRQVFSKDFADLLDVRDGGNIGQVFIGDQQANKWLRKPSIDIHKDSVNIGNIDGSIDSNPLGTLNPRLNTGLAAIQVASTKGSSIGEDYAGLKTQLTDYDPRDVLLNSSVTHLNSGLTTVIRYYIDKDKLIEKGFNEDDLAYFNFYTSYITEGEDIARFEGTNTSDKDLVILKNSKIKIYYPDGYTLSADKQEYKYSLKIGSDPHSIELRSNFDHTGNGKTYEYTLTFDKGMTIPKGEKIVFRTGKYDRLPSRVELTIDGETISLYPNSSTVVNEPTRYDFIASYSGGAASQTALTPDIDEIFTDTKALTGRSKYSNADIDLYLPGKEESMTFKGGKDPVDGSINGEDLPAYEFTTLNKEGVSLPDLVKDYPLTFSNTDVMSTSVESDKVVEQVQAKVRFELNGGRLPLDTLSFEGFDRSKPGEEFAYLTQRSTEFAPVKRIVPMNENYSTDPSYKANGFADGTNKDHNGQDLSGDALKLRQFLDLKPTKTNEYFLGWSNKLVDPEEFKELEELRDVSQWSDGKAYKVTANSPIEKNQTVYAIYADSFKLILHANNDSGVKYEIPIQASDFKSDGARIEIPQSPYWNMDKVGVLDEFTKTDPSNQRYNFIGWSAKADGNGIYLGYNLSDLVSMGELTNDEIKNEAYNYSSLIGENLEPTSVMLPNDFDLILPGTIGDYIANGDINLYAQYRPFFDIEVTKNYRLIDGEDTDSPSYVDSEDIIYKPDVMIGLLYRTAVTNYIDPTVHQAANYYNLEKDQYQMGEVEGFSLQKASVESPTVSFSLPGYDELGQRLSYSAVETQPGNEQSYYNFDNNWSNLGITIYSRIPGQGEPVINEGPIDPADNNRNISKIQTITFPSDNSDDIDAFSSATTRSSQVRESGQGEYDLKGYNIQMYNVPRDTPQPIFDKVYDQDSSFKLSAEGLTNGVIDSILIKYPGLDDFVRFIYSADSNQWFQAKKNPDVNSAQVYIKEDKETNIIGTIEISDNNFVFTRKEGNFAKAEVIYARYGKADLTGPVGQTTVLDQPVNIPINQIWQEKNLYDESDTNHENPNVVISARIPEGSGGVLYEPPAGTEYHLVDINNNPILGLDGNPLVYTKKPGEQSGSTISFEPFDPYYNNLSHKDELKIISKMKDFPNIEDAYSTSNPIIIEGPIAEISYKDDYFRRWMDITVTLKDENYPVVGTYRVELELTDDITLKNPDGNLSYDESSNILTIENVRADKNDRSLLPRIYRTDDIINIKVIGEDKFGNLSEVEIPYTEVKQIVLEIESPQIGDDFILYFFDQALIEEAKEGELKVQTLIKRGNQTIFDDTFSATEDFEMVDLLDGNNNFINLEEGDIIDLEAKLYDSEGNLSGKTNPFRFAM